MSISAPRVLPILALGLSLVSAGASAGRASFIEVSTGAGLTGTYDSLQTGFGMGAAVADFDGDGFVDIFLPTAPGTAPLLYQNQGDGTFDDVAADRGLTSTEAFRAALWLDYDGDDRLDLLLGADCFVRDCTQVTSFTRLYRQTAQGSFEDVTVAAGLFDTSYDDEAHRSGFAAGDIDGDGDVDFVSSFWKGNLRLFLNQGDGTFADMTATSGIDAQAVAYHQPVLQDFDGDGRIDLYSTVDFTENRLWLNQGTTPAGVPTLVEVAQEAGCANAMNDMGIALGDPDQDGDLDAYITNIYRDGFHNVLLNNQSTVGAPSFSEISGAAGVQDGAWGWGATFFDLENDGDLDIAEVNGWHTNTWDSPSRLFVHQGTSPPTFVDQAAALGFTADDWGSSLAAFDYDLDGDLDLFETVPKLSSSATSHDLRLHQNQLDGGGATTRFLLVRPRMDGANRRALGAKVTAHTGADGRVRWISAGGSYLGQEPAEAFFGLGNAGVVDRLDIEWPNGKRTVQVEIAVDQVITVQDQEIFRSGFESGDLSHWSAP